MSEYQNHTVNAHTQTLISLKYKIKRCRSNCAFPKTGEKPCITALTDIRSKFTLCKTDDPIITKQPYSHSEELYLTTSLARDYSNDRTIHWLNSRHSDKTARISAEYGG